MPGDDADDGTKLRPDLRRGPAAAAAPLDEGTRHRGRNTSLDPLAAFGADGGVTQTRTPRDARTRRPLNAGDCIRRRYVLQQLIGEGGMGQVWKAKDLVSEQARDPNPYVAIKVLNTDFETDPDAFVSLQRETRKAQELAHPNIITVYAFDIDDDGSHRAFMSMELLEGEGLDTFIRRNGRGVPRAAALPIINGMAKGLEYAHKKGIVHADFKPGNVFVARAGEPKVLDFGIARAANIAGIERVQDSFDAGTLGGLTIAYASKQMIEQEPPHPGDDVYALGLVAYEVLSGDHPFKRHSAAHAAQHGMKAARIRGIRRYEWQAISRALEFDRRKRWQNAGEFLRAFAGRSFALQAVAAVAVALAVAAGAFWYQAYRAEQPAVPFEALPAEVQAEFRAHMSTADGAWRLVEQGNGDESQDAASEYGKAYGLHPRNRAATRGLKKAADYAVKRYERLPDRRDRLQALQAFQQLSDYYAHYKPLTAAIERAGGN